MKYIELALLYIVGLLALSYLQTLLEVTYPERVDQHKLEIGVWSLYCIIRFINLI